jgi:hypothetical protein
MNRDNFQSDEEFYMYLYLEELKSRELADYKYQSRSFTLFEGSKHKLKFKKGAITPRDVSYTADFVITWHPQLRSTLFSLARTNDEKTPFVAVEQNGFFFSIIDVKGSFAGKNNTSAVTFPLKQKWMLEKFGIYVQKIIPISKTKGLFVDTFTPVKYLLTPTGKERKLHYKPLMINKYLEINGIK